MRVDGQNQHCQIGGNPLYTAYFTTEKKNRLPVIAVLRNSDERIFRLNEAAVTLLDILRLPAWVVRQLNGFPQDQDLRETEFLSLLKKHLPDLAPPQAPPDAGCCGCGGLPRSRGVPDCRLVIGAAAPQFKLVTAELALGWVHDG